ncbi:MAG TPA: hypothetical protein VIV62_06090 [Chthoniobacterales bacterium]
MAAQGIAEALKNLEAAIKKEIESKPAPTGPALQGYRDRSDGGRAAFAQIQTAIANGENRRAEEQLTQMQMYFASDEVHQQTLKLAAALKAEREAKQNAHIAEVNAALKQASDAVHRAKTPEDLDDALDNLLRFHSDYQGVSDHTSEAERSTLSKVEPALTFLKHWQDYLAAQQSGSAERARQSLGTLLSSGNSELLPRSRVLAELQKYPTEREAKAEPPGPEQIDEIVAKVKSLEGLGDAIRELRKIQSRSRSDAVTSTLNALVPIERTYREFQAGLPTRLDASSMYGLDPISFAVIPLRAQLLLLVLPRYLNAPADLVPKPRESVQAYLQRVIDEARARADIALLTRARDAQRFLAPGSNQSNTDMAITLMTAAKNQETAGQYMLAVISYQNALRNGGEAVPAKLIGEKLAALKAAHPQEYDEAMKNLLWPSRYDYPAPFPRAAPTPVPMETQAALPIPAAGASAPAKPAASASPSTTPR